MSGEDEHEHDHEHGHMVHEHDHGHMVHEHRGVQGGQARAAVFGVSDGLVSNVALILGVAAAGSDADTVILAGLTGLLAGAASMAAGEYVSVKAQAELVEREIEIERVSIAEDPEMEQRELAAIYRKRGLDASEADTLASAVMADPEVALDVHAREELGVDPDETGDPAGAAIASFAAFTIGAVLPLIPWFFLEGTAATILSVAVGIIASAIVGVTLASFTKRSAVRTAARQVGFAVGACLLTFAIGSLFGATVT